MACQVGLFNPISSLEAHYMGELLSGISVAPIPIASLIYLVKQWKFGGIFIFEI
jgi:hypothetical protein